jgi:organic radical activating enzyme
MKNNSNSILALQHSGGGASNLIFDQQHPQLKSIWIEIPDYCHLNCAYCYADTKNEPKSSQAYLSFEDYERILREFKKMGGKYVGIPGKGEPFDKRNWELTKRIIYLCTKLGLELAIFTTGDSIFFDPTDGIAAKPQYDKFKYIKDKNVILLIKCNSLNCIKQNKLVGDKRNKYAQKRKKAINILIKEGLNKERRLGIVTSVVKENKGEIVKLYKWAEKKNIIFDCDTILERGRGKPYTENGNVPSKTELEMVFKKLKDAGAAPSCQGGTYVGCTCDRILHHLYVSVKGDVYPCIGCLKEDVEPQKNLLKILKLGNLIDSNNFQNKFFEKSLGDLYFPHNNPFTLKKAWEHSLRKQLADKHKDTIIGVCQQCQNFINELCYSCLGRCISKVEEIDNGEKIIHTHGCIHHKPSTTIWLVNVVDYIRKILSFESIKDSIKKDGLVYLWQPPDKEIAYSSQQINDEAIIRKDSKNDDNFQISLKPKDPQNNNDAQKIIYYSKRKHYYLDDIEFPVNTVWDFIRFPRDIINESKFIEAFSYACLSNVFIPSVMILLRRYDDDAFVRYFNFMLYDNLKKTYFYRSFAKGKEKSKSDSIIQSLIISRWTENFSEDENLWRNNCLDLSDFFSDQFYLNYTFKIGELDNSPLPSKKDYLFCDLTDIINLREIQEKADKFIEYVTLKEGGNESFKSKFDSIENVINRKLFTNLSAHDKNKMKELYDNINVTVFFKEENDSLQDRILISLQGVDLPESQKNKIWVDFNNIVDGKRKILNYFVYLAIIKKVFNVNYYNIIYSANFRENSDNSKNTTYSTLKPNGLLICTEAPLNTDFRSKLSLYISSISAPFDEFYNKENENRKQVGQMKNRIKDFQHTVLNFGTTGALRKLYDEFKSDSRFMQTYNYVEKACLLRDCATDILYSDGNAEKLILKELDCNTYTGILKLAHEATANNISFDDITSYIPSKEAIEKNIQNTIPDKDLANIFSLLLNLYSNCKKHNKSDFFIELIISQDNNLNIIFKNDGKDVVNFVERMNSDIDNDASERGINFIKRTIKNISYIEKECFVEGDNVVIKLTICNHENR